MNRRKFLQSVCGATILHAIPKPSLSLHPHIGLDMAVGADKMSVAVMRMTKSSMEAGAAFESFRKQTSQKILSNFMINHPECFDVEIIEIANGVTGYSPNSVFMDEFSDVV